MTKRQAFGREKRCARLTIFLLTLRMFLLRPSASSSCKTAAAERRYSLLELLDVGGLEGVVAGLIGGGGGDAGGGGFSSLDGLGGLLLGRLGSGLSSLGSHRGRGWCEVEGGGSSQRLFARGLETLSSVTCDRLAEVERAWFRDVNVVERIEREYR